MQPTKKTLLINDQRNEEQFIPIQQILSTKVNEF
jgi:hypothetical protein